jgi:hypothetical protein
MINNKKCKVLMKNLREVRASSVKYKEEFTADINKEVHLNFIPYLLR